MRKILQRAPRTIAWAAYACFAVKTLVPVGYMPAALAEGGPVVLCHSGYQGELVRYLGRKTSQHVHSATHTASPDAEHPNSHDIWTHCPVGNAFSSFALTTSPPQLALIPQRPVRSPDVDNALIAIESSRHQPIRAPPKPLAA